MRRQPALRVTLHLWRSTRPLFSRQVALFGGPLQFALQAEDRVALEVFVEVGFADRGLLAAKVW
jgi:hypothetical protein